MQNYVIDILVTENGGAVGTEMVKAWKSGVEGIAITVSTESRAGKGKYALTYVETGKYIANVWIWSVAFGQFLAKKYFLECDFLQSEEKIIRDKKIGARVTALTQNVYSDYTDYMSERGKNDKRNKKKDRKT